MSLLPAAARGVPYPGRWWLAVLAVPATVGAWLVVALATTAAAPHVGLGLVGAATALADVLAGVGVACALFAPLALRHDRRYVAARTGWRPSRAYYLVVVPLVGAPVAAWYCLRRRRAVDAS